LVTKTKFVVQEFENTWWRRRMWKQIWTIRDSNWYEIQVDM